MITNTKLVRFDMISTAWQDIQRTTYQHIKFIEEIQSQFVRTSPTGKKLYAYHYKRDTLWLNEKDWAKMLTNEHIINFCNNVLAS